MTKQLGFARIVRNGSRKAKMWLWWPRKELYNQFQPLKANDPIKTIPLLPDGPPGHSISSRCHPPVGQNKEQTLPTSNIHTKEQDYGFCTKLFLFEKFNDQTNLRTGPTSSEKSEKSSDPGLFNDDSDPPYHSLVSKSNFAKSNDPWLSNLAKC